MLMSVTKVATSLGSAGHGRHPPTDIHRLTILAAKKKQSKAHSYSVLT